MKTIEEMRNDLREKMELEEKLVSLHAEEKERAKELKNAAELLESLQDKLQQYEKTSVLRLFGAKRQHVLLEDEQKAASAHNALDYQYASLLRLISSTESALSALSDVEEQLYRMLPPSETVDSAKEHVEKAASRFSSLAWIEELMTELKKLLADEEKTWEYGDLQTDLSGRRYNNKLNKMREETRACREPLHALYELAEKADLLPQEPFDIELMDKPALYEEEIHERFIALSNWRIKLQLRLKEARPSIETEAKESAAHYRSLLLSDIS